MKTSIEDYLQGIDLYFKEKSQKDIYMTYFMIFAVIFAFSYLLFWDSAEADFKAKRAQVIAVKQKIVNDNIYLQQNPETKITQIENETARAKKQMLAYKDSNKYIKTKIEEISALVYDEVTWGEYLHSISKKAKANNIKILDFNNRYAKNDGSFGHILDISLKTTGNYANTINFINSLEQSDLVVDLHTFGIKAKDKLTSDLNISVWGITY
ncbi:MAG: type 4a pilus biogenesis protein PilO [Sulfurimonas sp.]|nr:type 4a pilus biogenesis protein PilO [Sulfurimonas sp.]